MPIDLVIDEREAGKSPSELGLTGNGDANRSLDSASHTDGASTPDVVSEKFAMFFYPREDTLYSCGVVFRYRV